MTKRRHEEFVEECALERRALARSGKEDILKRGSSAFVYRVRKVVGLSLARCCTE